jgi:circadian clock protein KaiC
MNTIQSTAPVEKLQTGIDGLDLIGYGGLPKGRTTLISGTAGSAKTIMACQYLAGGITKHGEGGVFVTFEESPKDIRKNMLGFGWDIQKWENEARWAFVDAAPHPGEETYVTGTFDLDRKSVV